MSDDSEGPPYLLYCHLRCSACQRLLGRLDDVESVGPGDPAGTGEIPRIETRDGETVARHHGQIRSFMDRESE